MMAIAERSESEENFMVLGGSLKKDVVEKKFFLGRRAKKQRSEKDLLQLAAHSYAHLSQITKDDLPPIAD